ncbi:hypothetical protein ACFW3D_32820 [Streptomyces sp. NPDC058864]
MGELPPDLNRLRVIRLYLQLQLDAVDARIRETMDESAAVAPPAPAGEASSSAEGGTGYRLQHVPRGGSLRGVVHLGDCPDAAGGWINRHELEIALRMPEVTTCPRCHPSPDSG